MKNTSFPYNHGLRGVVRVFLVTLLALTFTSCRTIKETEYITVTDTVTVHDTTEVTTHDTVTQTYIKIDSVDRIVEKITYVDSNGVWHEKEKETLTHYITVMDEQYKVRETEYKRKIEKLEKQLKEKEQTKIEYVEKKLNWFQRMLIMFGICFIIFAIGFGMYFYFKIKKK